MLADQKLYLNKLHLDYLFIQLTVCIDGVLYWGIICVGTEFHKNKSS